MRSYTSHHSKRGEVAASKLVGYLRPETVTVYAKKIIPKFYSENLLKKNTDGEVEVLKKFWFYKDRWEEKGLVPPLLVYADLLSSGDQRNLEVARIIYDKEIFPLILKNGHSA